jgi:hypothetical protein
MLNHHLAEFRLGQVEIGQRANCFQQEVLVLRLSGHAHQLVQVSQKEHFERRSVGDGAEQLQQQRVVCLVHALNHMV